MTITGYRLRRWPFSSPAGGCWPLGSLSCCLHQLFPRHSGVCRLPVKKQLCPVRYPGRCLSARACECKAFTPASPLAWQPFLYGPRTARQHQALSRKSPGPRRWGISRTVFSESLLYLCQGTVFLSSFPSFRPSQPLRKLRLGSPHSPWVLPNHLVLRHLFRASV